MTARKMVPDLISALLQDALLEAMRSKETKIVYDRHDGMDIEGFFKKLISGIVSEIGKDAVKPLSSRKSHVQLEEFSILGIPFSLYLRQERGARKINGLVNIVFPCRNSSALLSKSIPCLLDNIRKAEGLNFNVVFVVNNSSDDSVGVILSSLSNPQNELANASFYVLESPIDLFIGLPRAINCGQAFIAEKLHFGDLTEDQIFFSFWDDELESRISIEESIFSLNVQMLMSDPNCKAASGYMIDDRKGISKWHEICTGFSSDISIIGNKPYLHGGAGTVMRFCDYPSGGGIRTEGIADTDLGAVLLSKMDLGTIAEISPGNWPIRSNCMAPIYHPTERDIVAWTIKYLMYFCSWENTISNAYDDERISAPAMRLWEMKIEENRKNFHNRTHQLLASQSNEKILEVGFMRAYFKTLKRLGSKIDVYESLKIWRKRSY